MNLFKKALLAVLGLGLVVAPSAVEKVEATKGKGDEIWSLAGTINGWSTSDKTYEFTYDSKDAAGARYELQIPLTAGDEFKVIYNHNSWDIGYGSNTGAGISTYLSNSGGNFKVKTTGNYILWVKDDNVHNYGDKSYGFGIEKAAVTTNYTVTYYNRLGAVADTETVPSGTIYKTTYLEEEGFRLEGWYTNSSLTTAFVQGSKITANTSLYPKYVKAEDYKIYFEDNGTFGATVDAYFYSDDDRNNTWPGEKMTKEENGFWSFTVDASKGFNHVIFGNGQDEYVSGTSTINSKWAQTANLDLAFDKEAIYTIGAKDTDKKYTATVTFVEDLEAAANLSIKYQQNGSSVRIISTLGAGEDFSVATYENVGFRFELDGVEKEVTAGYVYTSVIADGEPISAETYGAAYFYVATFNNVPTGVTLNVTPFATLTNGFVVTGQQTALTF